MTRPKVPDEKRQRTAQACDSCKRRKQKVRRFHVNYLMLLSPITHCSGDCCGTRLSMFFNMSLVRWCPSCSLSFLVPRWRLRQVQRSEETPGSLSLCPTSQALPPLRRFRLWLSFWGLLKLDYCSTLRFWSLPPSCLLLLSEALADATGDVWESRHFKHTFHYSRDFWSDCPIPSPVSLPLAPRCVSRDIFHVYHLLMTLLQVQRLEALPHMREAAPDVHLHRAAWSFAGLYSGAARTSE